MKGTDGAESINMSSSEVVVEDAALRRGVRKSEKVTFVIQGARSATENCDSRWRSCVRTRAYTGGECASDL